MKVLKKLRTILLAKIRVIITKPEEIPEWVKNRRTICQNCPFNSKHTPYYKRDFRWYKWYILNSFKSFCTMCGCGINPLTFSELSECEIKKWKSIL